MIRCVDRLTFVIADVLRNFLIVRGTENSSFSRGVRSKLSVGSKRAGVGRVARGLYRTGNY